jgi:glycerol kinase
MRSVLAIDEGTTGTTCLVIADNGQIMGRGYREITQYFPEPGWVEHDADEIFARTIDAAREAIAMSGLKPEAIGITNQRETCLLWDRVTGAPFGRAIVWQDRRTAARCAALAPQKEQLYAATGLVNDPYFSGSKIEWLLGHRLGTSNVGIDRIAAGTIDSWLIWKLTDGAVHATDHTNASRTMLYDINSKHWSAPLCTLFNVPMSVLPEVRKSSGAFGIASAKQLGYEIPILGVAGDQQAALYGQGCWTAGTSKNTYGTGAFLLLNTGATRPVGGGGMLTTIACDAAGDPCYALEASIFIAGAAIQWLRDGLGIVARASDTEAIARSLQSNDGVYFVPALTGLGAPEWEANARGTIVGLTRGTTKDHLVRAALEAMCYGTADVLGAMRDVSGARIDVLRVDGGATANGWLMQFQSDALGVPVERPDVIETTAMGAGALAGIACGVWPNAAAFMESRRYHKFVPGAGALGAQHALAGWRRAVRAAVSWARDTQ